MESQCRAQEKICHPGNADPRDEHGENTYTHLNPKYSYACFGIEDLKRVQVELAAHAPTPLFIKCFLNICDWKDRNLEGWLQREDP